MKILIDIGGTFFRICLVDNNIIGKVNIISINNIFDDLYNNILLLSQNNNITQCNISCRGYIEDGKMYDMGNVGNNIYIDIIGFLNDKFHNILFKILNDGDCYALAEKHEGKMKDINNFVVFAFGTGVGIGIYINNQLIKNSEISFFIEKHFSGKKFENLEKKDYFDFYNNGAKIIADEIIRFICIFNIYDFVICGKYIFEYNFFSLIKEYVRKNINSFYKEKINIVSGIKKNNGLIGALYIN